MFFFAMSSPAAPDFPIEDAQGLVWAFCIYSGGLLFLRPCGTITQVACLCRGLFAMESCSLVGETQEMVDMGSWG